MAIWNTRKWHCAGVIYAENCVMVKSLAWMLDLSRWCRALHCAWRRLCCHRCWFCCSPRHRYLDITKNFFLDAIKIYYSSSSRIKQEHRTPLPRPPPPTPPPPLLRFVVLRHVKTNYVVIIVISKLLGLIRSCDKGNGFPFLWLLRKDNNGWENCGSHFCWRIRRN